jgi:biofilm PGA synthesis N-glycosyltransferase PgaC
MNDTPKVIALLPAHNEEEQIGAAIDALVAQSAAPDVILVILDNCTDGTERIARSYGGNVVWMHTVGNTDKKAGALNQALRLCKGFDYILDTDADAILGEHFVRNSLALMLADPTIGAVSAREGIKLYHNLSIKERLVYATVRYQRYLWDTMRMENPENTQVVVGPGAMLRTEAVFAIGGWDNHSLTEDNALSMDLRIHGWRTVLGKRCYVWSDSPLGLRELWRQRVRWSRGVEDYKSRPWSRATWRGKVEYGFHRFLLVWTAVMVAWTCVHLRSYNPLWLLPMAFIYAERVSRMRLFPKVHAADLVLALPPCEFATFLAWQATNLAALYQRLAGRQRNW